MEHQVIRASLTAKCFGEHLGKKGWKARVVDGIGAAVSVGVLELLAMTGVLLAKLLCRDMTG